MRSSSATAMYMVLYEIVNQSKASSSGRRGLRCEAIALSQALVACGRRGVPPQNSFSPRDLGETDYSQRLPPAQTAGRSGAGFASLPSATLEWTFCRRHFSPPGHRRQGRDGSWVHETPPRVAELVAGRGHCPLPPP